MAFCSGVVVKRSPLQVKPLTALNLAFCLLSLYHLYALSNVGKLSCDLIYVAPCDQRETKILVSSIFKKFYLLISRVDCLLFHQEKMTLMQASVNSLLCFRGSLWSPAQHRLWPDSHCWDPFRSSVLLSQWQHCFLCYSATFSCPLNWNARDAQCRRRFFLDTNFKMYHWDVMLTWAVIMGFVFVFLTFSSSCCLGIIPTMYRSL